MFRGALSAEGMMPKVEMSPKPEVMTSPPKKLSQVPSRRIFVSLQAGQHQGLVSVHLDESLVDEYEVSVHVRVTIGM